MTEIITKMMYNDTVRIDFYPKSHAYKLVTVVDWEEKKESLISVSAITWVVDKSQPLIYRATGLARDYLLGIKDRTDEEVIRACQLHREKKEESANIGTLAHEWAENFTKTWSMSLPEDERVANAVKWFIDWKTENNVEFEHSEIMIYSKKYNYVGILDWIATINWKRYLIDYKTSNSIYLLTYWMQTVAYMKWYEEQTGEKLDGVIIVKFAKDTEDKYWNPIPSFEVQEIVEIDYMFNAFLSAKVLKEAVKKYDKFNK